MASSSEVTFKDLQTDERYKRLERTLKMVLLRNADCRTSENCSTGAWPSISSINGDHLDTSCAAMSVQSSRIGSEVVASSSNLRNILAHKKSSGGPRNSMVTSSENQFSMNKDEDTAMMPPPRMPGPSSARSKRFSMDTKRIPLLNMSVNLDRSENGFTSPTPAIGVSSIPQCSGSVDGKAALREQNDYSSRIPYEESKVNGQPSKPQERIFSRWRVILNDKTQLIIKGTLECGKVARSKPVIRRLTATSVQSIFKHTYHLRGNLVDERNELPEYVSGKFCNGFPDDWENVCQVWRNFVSAGSRLSFRWPTPITDSDDDIKSEMTDISYPPRFEKHNKSRSPRKRTKYSKPLSPLSPAKTHAEHSDRNQCACSQMKTPSINLEDSIKSSVSGSRTRPNQSTSESKGTAPDDKSKSLHDTSTTSLDNRRRVIGNSLKDMIQEDKLNIIIDNLTSKNCSLEYIHKIVEMFDCMKYVVTYQSAESNNSENANLSKNVNESCTPNAETRSMEETNDRAKPPQHSGNRSVTAINDDPDTSNKSQRSRCSENARRRLTKEDYDSTESENDAYDPRRRTSVDRRSHDESRKSHRFKDYKVANNSARTKQRYRDCERIVSASRETSLKFNEERRDGRQDSSLSEEDYSMNQPVSVKDSRSRALTSPRKRRIGDNELAGDVDHRDSSISLTEEDIDDCYKKEPRLKVTRKEYYDSSVSITEDERGEVRVDRKPVDPPKYYPQTSSRSVEPDAGRTDDPRNGQKATLRCFNESNRYSVDANIGSDAAHKSSGKTSPIQRVITSSLNCQDHRDRANDFTTEPQEDSAYMSSDVKRQKTPGRILAETDSTKSYANDRPKAIQCNAGSSTPVKTMTQQTKKPVVVSCEIINPDARQYDPLNMKNNENDMNVHNAPRKGVRRSVSIQSISDSRNTPIGKKITAYLIPEHAKTAEPTNTKNAKKEKSANVNNQNDETESRETDPEKEKATDVAEKKSVAKFGSEENPKQLTGWVPAVIYEDDDGSKCRLVFEGKLLNEAGHVVNRKFTTDFVKRRRSAKLIETVSEVFYQLVGDLNDTKHMVPKALVKLCHTGCPSKINYFCEKWKSLSSVNNETPKKLGVHNTSVDCLSVPTSSRGRRILPPLNYWTGERVTTKDNRAVYSPGNCKETSFTSSLEKTNEDAADEGNSPKTRKNRVPKQAASEKRLEVDDTNGAKKKKISPTAVNKSSTKRSPHHQESPKRRIGKKRLTRKKHDSCSDSSEGETEMKVVLKKRKARTNDSATKADTSPKRKLRNSSKNTGSPQGLEQSTSSHRSSFENGTETETKWKFRKRQKMNQDEGQLVVAGTSRQLTRRGSSGITCTFYRNVPLHDGDLSVDQLSTM